MSKRSVAVAVAALVLVVGGFAAWWFLLRSDAPEEASLRDRAADVTDTTTGEPPDSADGTWTVAPDGGTAVFVGYRIDEQFAGETITKTAAGRTPAVEGTMVLAGDEVTETEVTADLTGLASDEERRDRFLQGNGLEIDQFPEASFALTEPVDLGGEPARDEVVTATATGELTLHGQTQEVEIPLEARWNGATIDVSGSTPIVLADYGIQPPEIGGFVTVADEGVLELQLTFAPA